jgi:hypothetical protein
VSLGFTGGQLLQSYSGLAQTFGNTRDGKRGEISDIPEDAHHLRWRDLIADDEGGRHETASGLEPTAASCQAATKTRRRRRRPAGWAGVFAAIFVALMVKAVLRYGDWAIHASYVEARENFDESRVRARAEDERRGAPPPRLAEQSVGWQSEL